MLVPVVVAASTSPSPANVPPAIFTVAFESVRLSASATTAADETVFAPPFSVKPAVATPESVGGSFTPTTVNVVVVTLLTPDGLPTAPSSTCQVMVRVVLEP